MASPPHPSAAPSASPSEAPSATHPSDLVVTRDDFRERLRGAVAAAPSASAGLFGPGSAMWEVNRHTLVYGLGLTQAAFLDVAHPVVAHGIADHSTLFTDPRSRGHQTYALITSIVFGTTDDAVRASRALFTRHDRVAGTARAESGEYAVPQPYRANTGDVLLWVHATMWWVRLRLHEAIVGPLSPAERERFHDETRRFADCFAIPEHLLPADYASWDAYVREGPGAGDVLAPSPESRRIMAFLSAQIPWPARAHLLAFNSVMLPAPAREVLGLPALTPRTLRRHRRMLRALRLLQRLLPAPLRELPPYRVATARVAVRDPDRLTRWLAGALAGRRPAPAARKASS